VTRRIIIDTDPGIDDAMAIAFAMKSLDLALIGLTTIYGNAYVHETTRNALQLMHIADRPDIPVAQGATHSLVRPFARPAYFVHGEDAMGNVNLSPPPLQPVSQTAAAFIIEQVMATPGEVTLVAIGPLTNLALALHLEPRIADNVAEVVLMGGNAIEAGNASPVAEANILGDPEAADVVFGANWQVTMVGLDVTHRIIMTPDHLAAYAEMNDPLAQHIHRILPTYVNFHKVYYGFDGIYVHDSTAIAYLLLPDAFTVERLPVRVETQGISRGKTWVSRGYNDNDIPWHNRPPVNVCLDVDAARTLALELDIMRGG
jgi:inosine-uridine nucleoside N-ribohydrolase